LRYDRGMLLGFSVSNYQCFADEASINLVRPSLRTQVPKADQSWIDVTYRVAALYGANASGKSTFLRAFSRLCAAVTESARFSSRLHNPDRSRDENLSLPTVYDVNFLVDSVRYHYTVEAHPWGISFESLHAYPRGVRRHLFTRTQTEGGVIEVKAGTGLIGPTAQVLKVTTSQDLFLAAAYRYGHTTLAPIAKGLRVGVSVTIVEHSEFAQRERIDWVMTRILEDPLYWQAMVNALAQAADLGIKRIEVREQDVPPKVLEHIRSLYKSLASQEEEGVELPEDLLSPVARALVFVHSGPDGTEFELSLNAQSEGTRTWLATIGPAVDALRKGKVLVVDELDASLHPALVATLVGMFKDPDFNRTGAQLIFSTHDTALLGNVPARQLEPPEVWFCEKDAAGCSEIVSLDEYDTRKGNNEQKRYLSGRFGAMPRVDLSRLLAHVAADNADSEG